MKKLLICALLSVVGFSAHAGGAAYVTCGDAPPGVDRNGQRPVLHVQYSPGETGLAGLIWIGIATPDWSEQVLYTGDGGWVGYGGGMMPFYSRHDGGLPSSIYVKIPFPGTGLTTNPYVGYHVSASHGVLNEAAKSEIIRGQLIKERTAKIHADGRAGVARTTDGTMITSQAVPIPSDRSGLIGLRQTPSGKNYADLKRNPSQFAVQMKMNDDNLNYAYALIQGDMVDNEKYQHLLDIPFIDCELPPPEPEPGL